ncbi:hypothetical protein [Pararobbsia alpina]|uniref:Uncharacterized protein n=1 Tax=Pararobbsia alpina TaxID=621374 RepID=A0A6S7CYT2_9BURK|nr:hypothetical protein [Pararobbsia alpina]CAB3801391.1 hypothetical protein LMG28138_05003 [Pararobbsia alpina]
MVLKKQVKREQMTMCLSNLAPALVGTKSVDCLRILLDNLIDNSIKYGREVRHDPGDDR